MHKLLFMMQLICLCIMIAATNTLSVICLTHVDELGGHQNLVDSAKWQIIICDNVGGEIITNKDVEMAHPLLQILPKEELPHFSNESISSLELLKLDSMKRVMNNCLAAILSLGNPQILTQMQFTWLAFCRILGGDDDAKLLSIMQQWQRLGLSPVTMYQHMKSEYVTNNEVQILSLMELSNIETIIQSHKTKLEQEQTEDRIRVKIIYYCYDNHENSRETALQKARQDIVAGKELSLLSLQQYPYVHDKHVPLPLDAASTQDTPSKLSHQAKLKELKQKLDNIPSQTYTYSQCPEKLWLAANNERKFHVLPEPLEIGNAYAVVFVMESLRANQSTYRVKNMAILHINIDCERILPQQTEEICLVLSRAVAQYPDFVHVVDALKMYGLPVLTSVIKVGQNTDDYILYSLSQLVKDKNDVSIIITDRGIFVGKLLQQECDEEIAIPPTQKLKEKILLTRIIANKKSLPEYLSQLLLKMRK